MNSAIIFLLFITALISGLVVLYKKVSPSRLKLILSFSGAFLFSICVLHLIPEVYESGGKVIGSFILIGFFVQIVLELLSEGIEHGHIHVHSHHEHKFPLAMMAGLCIHSFLEGIPLAETSTREVATNQALLIGIILHNIPVGIALMSMLLQSGIKKSRSVQLLIFFCLMAPLGMISGNYINSGIKDYSPYIMAMVIGIFLHISTTILFETSENHRFNYIKFATILLGAILAFVTT